MISITRCNLSIKNILLLLFLASFAPQSVVSRASTKSSTIPTTTATTNAAHLPSFQKKHAQQKINGILTKKEEKSSFGVKRGGGITESLLSKEYLGVGYFVIFDIVLRKFFQSKDITFPSMMAGCVLLFLVLALFELIQPGLGDAQFQALTPGAGWLAKWLPSFFVPGLAMLPLAPKVEGSLEIAKVLSVILTGFFFTTSTTGLSTLAIRKLQGTAEESDNAPVAAAPTSTTPAPKAYPDDLQVKLGIGSLVFGSLSILLTKLDSIDATIANTIQTIFMLCTSFFAFVLGSNQSASFKKVIHPTLFSTFCVWIVTAIYAKITGSTFLDTLKTYKVNSFAIDKVGAGDFILFMLGPAVCSLSISMYSRKKLLMENLLVVTAGMLVSTIGGLFGTAAFVRLLKIQGDVIRLSLVSRNVTTALAMAIASILGGNISTAASVVVLTGIFGGTVGRSFMDLLNIKDPVCRGLALGAGAQGIGVAALVPEKDAFPFGAINMILTALCATSLVSIPAVKNLLVKIALGK